MTRLPLSILSLNRRALLVIAWSLAVASACGTTAATNGTTATDGASSTTDTSLAGTDGTSTMGDATNEVATGADVTDPGDAAAGTDASQGSDATPDAGVDAVAPGDTGSTTCPPVLKDKALGGHATACTQDSECQYGLCQKGGFLTGYDDTKGYCTKDCACTDKAAQCSNDNTTLEFLCGFEMSQSGGNPKAGTSPQKRCSLRCKSDAQCASWNPALPHCIQSTKYVSSAGVCGFDPFK